MAYINNNKIISFGGIKRAYLNNTLIFQSFKKNEEIIPQYDITSTFNVTSTTSPTVLCYSSATSAFTEMYVDSIKIDVTSGYTFSKTGEHTVQYMLADNTTIVLNAFYNCSGLTNVTIPSSVTSIGNGAFNGCSSLTSITIPEGVTSIGSSAFFKCSSLTSITIPDSVTSIGLNAFYNCSGLRYVTIPNSVTSIGSSAFYGCKSLSSVTIPDNVTSIGGNTFYNCSGLTNVTIPSSVTSIGNGAFKGCSRIRKITCYATTAPSLGTNVFGSLPTNGTLHIPQGSDYINWLHKLPSGWTIQYIT